MTGKIPKWRERQKLLYGRNEPKEPAKLSKIGNACLDEGFVQDAFEYFAVAKDSQGLAKIKKLAAEEGDVFLYQSLARAGLELDTPDWNEIGYRAFELGKHQFAKIAFEKTENELMLAKVEALFREAEPKPSNPDDSASG